MPPPTKRAFVRWSLRKNWNKFRARYDLLGAGYQLEERDLGMLLAECGVEDIVTQKDYELAVKNAPEWEPVLKFLLPLLTDVEAGRPKQVV